MTTPTVTVTLARWTYAPFPSSAPADRYTLVYTDPATGKVYRPATRATEFECRQFARAHGWAVAGVEDEED